MSLSVWNERPKAGTEDSVAQGFSAKAGEALRLATKREAAKASFRFMGGTFSRGTRSPAKHGFPPGKVMKSTCSKGMKRE